MSHLCALLLAKRLIQSGLKNCKCNMTVREASSTAHALKQGKAWKLALVLCYLGDVAASSRQLRYRLNEVENKKDQTFRDLTPEYDECCKSQLSRT